MSWIKTKIKINDLIKNKPHVLTVDNSEYLLIRTDEDEVLVVENICPHEYLPLDNGKVENGIITCPFHGAKFCLKTGEIKALPAFENLNTFKTKIDEENMIQFEIQ
jgi:3-phenylpropionate/trans-cinnamate dioxygenase ferredoxin subunit